MVEAIREIMIRERSLLQSEATNWENKERKELQSKERKASSRQQRHTGKQVQEQDTEAEPK